MPANQSAASHSHSHSSHHHKKSFFHKLRPEVWIAIGVVLVLGIGLVGGELLKPSKNQPGADSRAAAGTQCVTQGMRQGCFRTTDGRAVAVAVCDCPEANGTSCSGPEYCRVLNTARSEMCFSNTCGTQQIDMGGNCSMVRARPVACTGGGGQGQCERVCQDECKKASVCGTGGTSESPVQKDCGIDMNGKPRVHCRICQTVCPPGTPPTTVTPPPQISCSRKLDIALVIDRSGSMTGKYLNVQKIEYAKQAALAFINAMEKADTARQSRISIISWGAQGNDNTGVNGTQPNSPYNSKVHIGLSKDYNALRAALQTVNYQGSGTCIGCGIAIANQTLLQGQATNPGSSMFQILLTDGKSNKMWDGNDPAKYLGAREDATIRANNGRGAGINFKVLGYGSQTLPTFTPPAIDEDALKKLACQNPSDPVCVAQNYVWTPNPGMWAQSFVNVLDEICTGTGVIRPTLAPATPIPTQPPVASRPSITVTGGANTITVGYTNQGAQRNHWIGIYRNSTDSFNQFVDWLYLSGTKTPPTSPATSGTATFRNVPAGSYHVRYTEPVGAGQPPRVPVSRTVRVTGTGGTLPTTVPTRPTTVSQLSARCNATGTQVTLSWPAVSGSTFYALRVNKDPGTSASWTGTCQPGNEGLPGDYCRSVNVTSTTLNVTKGAPYNSWVHACSAAGCQAPISARFTCS